MVRHPNDGVVAIPEDTPENRAKAEKLMHEHLPDGYVIDDVRVVPVGRPYHTVVQFGPVAEVVPKLGPRNSATAFLWENQGAASSVGAG